MRCELVQAWRPRGPRAAVAAAVVVLAALACAGPVSATPGGPGGEQVVADGVFARLFRRAFLERAPWPAPDVEILRLQVVPSRPRVPAGRLSFDVEPPRTGTGIGRVTCDVTVKVDGVPRRRVRVSAWVEVYRPVVCVTAALPRGHVLEASDLEVARLPLSRLRGEAVSSPEAAVGQAVRRSVRAGQALTTDLLMPPVVVHRGDVVTILAQSPALTVRVPGEVRQDGARGCMVRVRNLMSRKEVVARVVDARTVAVPF
ncbi:flagellar basal body P-ring formation protein FlgA [Dissulfurirhabdus thermomarina]|uniref:Flagellar basal body P-ring formation protein FlgA n=1 Tax=Dissulfurirhabdus thermomarina TaxID=1765737 RepID=A0A6N9TQ80_DISTH|nr:flagellar basal body P-ring formation chaperone FlgA [Dissulfurirhabdus thermomarina]NDY42263.1 flagellar basal body P-ring formation protein FlgA [Dissulfurirhabdus thermomarina]NMX22768.1 flagellar basal body P-ring formation protein FlgA [Dissulfurirhabdus thermomarina]